VDETFRMMGWEHECDSEREAQKGGLAAVAGPRPVLRGKRPSEQRKMLVFLRLKGA
jgi:hypothetical protein